MLRRTIALALAGLAVAAPAALASPHWNSQIENASATVSRDADACSIGEGSRAGSLLVTCRDHQRAKLVYVFPTGRKVEGRPTFSISATGPAGVWASAKVTGHSVRIKVTVCGDGGTQLNTVSVGYYSGA